MSQKFYANPTTRFVFANGAIGYSPGGPFDCLGPYAKVKNCPIIILKDDGGRHDTGIRLTCYASGYADTYFSVPASTRRKGKHIPGFFTMDDGAVVFIVSSKHKNIFSERS